MRVNYKQYNHFLFFRGIDRERLKNQAKEDMAALEEGVREIARILPFAVVWITYCIIYGFKH